jgi:hypothetical protein
MPSNADAAEAARLLRYGLQPRLVPANDDQYTELVRRYRVDTDFRTLVEHVAIGLGLEVMDAGQFGVVLGAPRDGPFAYRLAEHRRRTNVGYEERLLHGLCFLAVAVRCFPQPAMLEEIEVRRVSVAAVDDFMRAVCEELRRRHGNADPRDDQPELEQAWRIWLRRNAVRQTPDGRRTPSSTRGMLSQVFELLDEQGMVQRRSDEEGGVYVTRTRFRLQVRELAATEGFQMLREVAVGVDGTPSDGTGA